MRRVLIASRCAQTILAQRVNLARIARDAGWRVDLAGQPVEGPYQAALQQEGFRFHPLPIDQRSLSLLSVVRSTIAFFFLCRNLRPDVFHAFTIKPTIAGLVGAWLARVPVRVATVAGLGHLFISAPPIVRLGGMLLLKSAMLFAQKIYFYNEADRQFFIKNNIVASVKTALVNGSGVDVSRYDVVSPPPYRPFRLLYIGRIIAEKGIVELLSALKSLQIKSSVELHVVGDLDPNNPSTLTQSEFEAELSEVGGRWHGHSNDVPRHIAAAHAIVLPSHREGIPLALLEAGASGRAMIATDVPGCRDVVRHGISGLLVPLGDIDALAAAINQLATDTALAERMGSEARRDIEMRFDTGVVNGAVVKDYEIMLDKRSGSPANFET
jgi:glycosyltransferase involved in cell wall biosynthesis